VPSDTPIPTPKLGHIPGTLRVDGWSWNITSVRTQPGKSAAWQVVVLIGPVTNLGQRRDLFTSAGRFVLKSANGNEYSEDLDASFASWDIYGHDSGFLQPGDTGVTLFAFQVPASEKRFILTRGHSAAIWSGDMLVTVP
jgi:hypothetical protein